VNARSTRWLSSIVALGVVVRIACWWFKGGFHYPDEIFQQLEPAHYLRTGVAWLPWEFVRGVRSWILPGFYAALLELLSWFGITGLPALRFVTLHNALWSVLMVPAGYRVGAALCARSDSEAERAGLAVALFTALLPTLVYYTPHTLIGTPAMIAMSWGYVFWLESRGAERFNSNLLLRCGLFFGIAGALRFTAGFHMLVPVLDLLWRHRARALRPLLMGAALPVLAVGIVDLFTWGWPFHSTVGYLRHHLFEGAADRTSAWGFYFAESLWGRFGPLAALSCFVLLAGLRQTWIVALAIIVPTFLLSFVPLKQDRFLMNNWPLLAAALGIGWVVLVRWVKARAPALAMAVGVTIMILVIVSNLEGTSELPWTLRRGMFRAQSFVGGQDDATGLLFEDRQHMNGGYLVFDRNAPQVQYEQGQATNPLFNYAALEDGGADATGLLRMGWAEVARFDEIVVLRREPAIFQP